MAKVGFVLFVAVWGGLSIGSLSADKISVGSWVLWAIGFLMVVRSVIVYFREGRGF